MTATYYVGFTLSLESSVLVGVHPGVIKLPIKFLLCQSPLEIYEQSFAPSPETHAHVYTRSVVNCLLCIALLCQSRRGISKGQTSTQEVIYASDTPEKDIKTYYMYSKIIYN